MTFKYKEIKELKRQYDEMSAAIKRVSEFVFRDILAESGYVCDGFDLDVEDDGTSVVLQNAWDDTIGITQPNCHISYPFRWLTMANEQIIEEYKTIRNGDFKLAWVCAGPLTNITRRNNNG